MPATQRTSYGNYGSTVIIESLKEITEIAKKCHFFLCFCVPLSSHTELPLPYCPENGDWNWITMGQTSIYDMPKYKYIQCCTVKSYKN